MKNDVLQLLFSLDKRWLKDRYVKPAHPYHLALEFGLERIYRLLKNASQDDALTFIVCEARGAKEDAELELEFRRIRDGANYFLKVLPFDLIIADKCYVTLTPRRKTREHSESSQGDCRNVD